MEFEWDPEKAVANLQKHGVEFAEGSLQFSSQCGEMVAEERLRQHFGVFETREAA
jgi:uncharacterized DUF497 family protein